MTSQHRVIIGDARHLDELADQSVHLVVTSPPYWQLKDYGSPDQLGFHDTYEDYVNHLNLVWAECARVLAPGCRLCVNVGDQFARATIYGRYKVIPIRTEITRFCETVGLDYMGAVIWRKVTTCNTSGGGSIMGSFPFPRNGILKLDYEFILLFRKPGQTPPPSAGAQAASKLTTAEWNEYFSGHWSFPGEKQRGHLAAFPEELPRRLIRMFTFVGETVLDPFLGSGTTAVAAQHLGRNSIGYEINPEFQPLIAERLGGSDLFAPADVHFSTRAATAWEVAAALGKLPYQFHDPLCMAPRRPPRAQTYGSRIAADDVRKTRGVRVVAVTAPDVLVLRGGRQLRLLGVTPVAATAAAAVQFLTDQVQGQAVVVSYDPAWPAGNAEGWCYVHLLNRTFVNARLVKAGLAAADVTRAYRHQARFQRYQAAIGAKEPPP